MTLKPWLCAALMMIFICWPKAIIFVRSGLMPERVSWLISKKSRNKNMLVALYIGLGDQESTWVYFPHRYMRIKQNLQQQHLYFQSSSLIEQSNIIRERDALLTVIEPPSLCKNASSNNLFSSFALLANGHILVQYYHKQSPLNNFWGHWQKINNGVF